jgi:hypothetical protein
MRASASGRNRRLATGRTTRSDGWWRQVEGRTIIDVHARARDTCKIRSPSTSLHRTTAGAWNQPPRRPLKTPLRARTGLTSSCFRERFIFA